MTRTTTEPAAATTGHRIPVVLLFAAIVADGFDTASLSFVIPTLSVEWDLRPSDFTLPLVATNVGAVIGYMVCGRLAARFGRDRVIWASVVIFSMGTVASVVATTVPALTAIRLLTGVGLGAVLPAAISLTADLVSPRRRTAASVLVTLGMPVGAIVGGMAGGPIIAGLGWQAVFWIAGGLAAGLAVLLWWRLPRVTELPGAEGVDGEAIARARVGVLFAAGLRARTTFLWAFAFLVFVVSHSLNTWLPTLLGEYGFTPAQAPLGTAVWGLGGVLGGVALAAAATYLGAPRVLVVMCALAATFLMLVALAPLAAAGLLLAIGLAGAGVAAGPAGQPALAIGIYDQAARTTGIAWAVALGRIGAIVGPAACGSLMALGLSGRTIILLAAGPILLACGFVAPLARTLARAGQRPVPTGSSQSIA